MSGDYRGGTAGASAGYSWVVAAPIEKPGQHIETQVVESGAGGYRRITTLTEFAERYRTNPRIIVTERRFEAQESEHGPYEVLVEEKVLSGPHYSWGLSESAGGGLASLDWRCVRA